MNIHIWMYAKLSLQDFPIENMLFNSKTNQNLLWSWWLIWITSSKLGQAGSKAEGTEWTYYRQWYLQVWVLKGRGISEECITICLRRDFNSTNQGINSSYRDKFRCIKTVKTAPVYQSCQHIWSEEQEASVNQNLLPGCQAQKVPKSADNCFIFI